MTQATDTDIREIKGAIDANTRAIGTLTDRIDSIVRLTEANTKAIGDLTLEMRVGFANVDTKLADMKGAIKQVEAKVDQAETKLEGKIDALSQKFDGLEGKVNTLTSNVNSLDGRLWGFGLTILASVLAALLTIFGRYIFTGLPIV